MGSTTKVGEGVRRPDVDVSSPKKLWEENLALVFESLIQEWQDISIWKGGGLNTYE